MVNAPNLPQADISRKYLPVLFDKRFQMNAADFFLALHDELDITGQFTFRLENCIDSMQSFNKIPLIIRHTASIHPAIADGQLKGRRFPQP